LGVGLKEEGDQKRGTGEKRVVGLGGGGV